MSTQNTKRQHRVLNEARNWIGTPYQHQASLCHTGCDCLGLVRGIWRCLYGGEPFIIPAYSLHWAETGKTETLLCAAREYLQEIPSRDAVPGDVLLFRFSPKHVVKHCAIVSASQRMIHAYWGQCVCESTLTPWWQRRIAAAFRFPD